MTTVAIALADATDRAALMRALPDRTVTQTCLTVDALERALRMRSWDLVVSETGFGLADNPHIVDRMGRMGSGLIVRMSLRRDSVRELVQLAQQQPALGVSIRCHDNVAGVLTGAVPRSTGPIGLVMPALSQVVSDEALPLLACAVAIGHTRIGDPAHAAILGLQPRTLQVQHQRLGLPAPHRLRAWGRALWAAWRLEFTHVSCKQAALAGGFASQSAMAEALKPLLGAAPRALAATGGLRGVVEALRRELGASAR